jgi:membrane complex biogenesis BtpA family protein
MSNSHQILPPQAIIGMIHLAALPGTPRYQGDVRAILAQALAEAAIYQAAGLDAIMIENMHDVPYLNRQVGPEITATMSVIATEIRRRTPLPCGLQILAGANREALAVALAAQLDFIRAEGFVFSHIADEGQMDACAAELLRYRRLLGAEHIKVFTDIKKKHSAHAITADVSIAETASAAEFFLSDGLIITGPATGAAADLEEIRAVRQKVKLPVWVGSGVTLANLEGYIAASDALIIGSYFKRDGYWGNPVDPDRCRVFMDKVKWWRDSQRLVG